MKNYLITLLLASALVGCGGGGDTPPASQTPDTPPPVVVVPPADNPPTQQPPAQEDPPVQQPPTQKPPTQEPPKEDPPVQQPPQAVLPVGFTDASKFTLTFRDEFNGTSLDLSKWNTKLWYEGDNPRQNYAVEDGVLKLWSVPPYTQNNRTVDTDGKFEQTYGYFEARMKLNRGAGQWPAFWLYGHPGNDRPEIDIMEAYPGGGPDSGWGDGNLNPVNYGITMHKANSDYSYHEVPFAHTMAEFRQRFDLSADYHVYAVHWDATGVQFYFDGQPIGPRYNDSVRYYNRPMYVIVDLWLGSASGSANGTSDGKQNAFLVDYVRVWQHK